MGINTVGKEETGNFQVRFSMKYLFLSAIFSMPKDIKSFFTKETSYADKRKAALEKRKQLLEDLHIDAVIFLSFI